MNNIPIQSKKGRVDVSFHKLAPNVQLSEKRQNRAWEKDRRDRLNNTFDNLAKLLPEYQPKINFSKVEILHKSIVYIEDLRKKLNDALSTQNASILKTQDDLEESIKVLVCQNNNLVELLEKANIKVPHFVRPKLLNSISITIHDKHPIETNDDENQNCKSETASETTPNICKTTHNQTTCKTNKTTAAVIVELSTNNRITVDKPQANSPEKPNGKLQSKQHQQQQIQHEIPKQKPQLSNLSELKEVQSFGSVDVIPVSNDTKHDPKVHEKPVKNFVEITPLISGQNEKISAKPEKRDVILVQPKLTPCIKESKSEKKSENVINVSTIRNNVQSSNVGIAGSESKDEIGSGGCAVATVIDKSKSDKLKVPSKQKEAAVHLQCDKKSPIKKCDSAEQKTVPVANQLTISTKITFETSENGLKNSNEQNKSTNDSAKVMTSSSEHQDDRNDIITSNETQHCGKRVENGIGLSKDEDLSDELFGNFRLDQTPNESNPNTLSPTAAFLLSFPVVSTVSSAKPTETDNSYSVGSSNLLRLDEKPNHPKDHCLFESISSILNDLNDVSESKIVSNVDNTHATSFTYSSNNKNRTNVEHNQKQSTSLIDGTCNGPRQKLNQKNLHINNLLSDDKLKYNNQSSSTKQQSNNVSKKIDSNAAAAAAAECLTNNQMVANPIPNDRTTYMSSSKSYENSATTVAHNENASDFYVSLSTLGLPLKSTVPLPPSTSINPSVGSHFNFQISSLAQPRNLIESRPLVADTPFTFSLTKNSDTTITSNVTTKSNVTQTDDQYHTTGHRSVKISHKKTTPTKHLVNDRFVMPTEPPLTTLNRCNSFNPFSFDNPTMLTNSSSSIGLPNLATVSSANSSIGTSFTFTLTPSFTTISTSTPLLSNHDPLFSSSFDMPLMRSTSSSNKTPKKEKPLAAFSNEKELQSSNWKNSTGKSCSTVQAAKSNKNLVNWMTSSVNKSSSSSSQDLQLDFIPQVASSHCVGIEEPSPWSPNRIAMDNPGLISSSALPMLQGDLALNTISNPPPPPAPPIAPPTVNKLYETDSKKSTTRQSNNQSKYNAKSSSNRKSEQNAHQSAADHRSTKCNKAEKISNHTFKSHPPPPLPLPPSSSSASSSRLGSESGTITNNFHSVSQLLDQERQTVNKNSYYIPPNDGKMLFKESNSTASMSRSKYYSKYDIDTNNHHHSHHSMVENKYAINACNTMSGNGGGSSGGGGGNSTSSNNNIIGSSSCGDILPSNECDRDLFGGYFFGQSKRLKLNYHHTTGDLSSNQTTYDNLSANDLTSYVNYQSYDNDCNNISANSCINNLTNQTYSYQYTQPQSYGHHHQAQQQPLNPCDSLESSTYFQAPVSTLCSYKPPTFNDVPRNDSKLTSTHQSSSSSSSFLQQPSKPSSIISATTAAASAVVPVVASTDYISNTKICSAPSISSSSSSNIISTSTVNYPSQMPISSANRCATTSTCPTKTIHYPSHANINHNLPLNQAWNDGFTWMPYTTNPIDKPYNNNLVFNTTNDTASNKTITSNNIAGHNNNNTIPNFNLTTIFPDYNKS